MYWKPIPFEISDTGEVRLAGRILPQRKSGKGYYNIELAVHRLVALAFHGEPPNDGNRYVTDHIDFNPSNNDASNLQWITQKENILRKGKHRPKKLNNDQVKEILAVKPKTQETLRQMAKRFGVSFSCINAIRVGHNWKPKTNPRLRNRAILTIEQVEEIRNWKAPSPSATQLSRKYRVSKRTILNVWQGKY